jgi:hypothetical protein
MTIKAAYQLHLDYEIGRIEFGKKADFCVLEADPLEIDPIMLATRESRIFTFPRFAWWKLSTCRKKGVSQRICYFR